MLYAVQVLRTAVSVCVRLSSFDGVFGRSNALCPCGGSVWWAVMGRDGCGSAAVGSAVWGSAWMLCYMYVMLWLGAGLAQKIGWSREGHPQARPEGEEWTPQVERSN